MSVRAEPLDRSIARVGSVAEDDPLHCVESLGRPAVLFEYVSVLTAEFGCALGLAVLGYALVPGGAPVGFVADEEVLCCVESFGRIVLAPPALVVLLDEVDDP